MENNIMLFLLSLLLALIMFYCLKTLSNKSIRVKKILDTYEHKWNTFWGI